MKILIAEDDVVSRRILEAKLLKWGHDVVTARDGAEAWQLLQSQEAPQLAILDWMMPDMNGVEICRELRRRAKEPYTYVLLLTAKNQKQDLVEGLEAGADDYLTKPFDVQELKVRLNAGARILELQSQLLSAREELRYQAAHDSLTHLWNHAAILDILRRELSRAEREGIPVGLVMVDIDHFKAINDTHGHMAGDAVLCEIAGRISFAIRPYDAIGRYGGDEFLIVLPGCDLEKTIKVAERLREYVSDKAIAISEELIHTTISIGVAATGEVGTEDVTSLIQAADAALYRAKIEGRNRVSSGYELVGKI